MTCHCGVCFPFDENEAIDFLILDIGTENNRFYIDEDIHAVNIRGAARRTLFSKALVIILEMQRVIGHWMTFCRGSHARSMGAVLRHLHTEVLSPSAFLVMVFASIMWCTFLWELRICVSLAWDSGSLS